MWKFAEKEFDFASVDIVGFNLGENVFVKGGSMRAGSRGICHRGYLVITFAQGHVFVLRRGKVRA